MKGRIIMVQVGKEATYMVDSKNTLIGSGNALKGQMGIVDKQKQVVLNPISFKLSISFVIYYASTFSFNWLANLFSYPVYSQICSAHCLRISSDGSS